MSVLTSIKKTIAYAKKYGGNLTEKQLFERLISNKIYTNQEIKRAKIGLITKKKNGVVDKKNKKAKKIVNLIEKKFKDILFLGITGSVAAGYPKKDDDIDIIVITKINKLWITRLKLRFFMVVNKIPHRKFGKEEKKDEFCFNLWLDEKSLGIRNEKQNLKNAVDLILIKTLINREQTYEKFIISNSWAKEYVATGYKQKISKFKLPMPKEVIAKNKMDKVTNWLIFWPQFWYMRKKIKNEKIGLHQAFFHH